MKTALQVVSKARRMTGLSGEYDAALAAGDTAAINGLDALISLYNKLISDGVFGPIRDVQITADYYAGENERVIDDTGAYAVSKPSTVQDDFGGERPTQDRAVILQPGPTPKAWLYDIDLISWIDVNALALADTAPLSGRFEGALCALLAQYLCSDTGLPEPPKVQRDAASAILALRRKLPVVVSVESALMRTLGRNRFDAAYAAESGASLITDGDGADITTIGGG